MDGIVFTQQCAVQAPYKMLGERSLLDTGLRHHHLERDLARDHLLHAPYIRFTNDLPKKQKNLRLPVSERVALDVVAVVVEIDRKTTCKASLVIF